MSTPNAPCLRIRLLGSLVVRYEDRREEVVLGGAFSDLLAYLVLGRGRSHARDVLAGVFWGEQSERRARSCLSTALWRLRSALERPDSPPYVVTLQNGQIAFDRDAPHWIDVEAFERGILDSGEDPGRREELLAALDLYAGPCLEGVYHDWAVAERERLELLYLRGLQSLMRMETRTGRLESALEAGLAVLRRDPLREDVHRAVMRLYLGTGRRAMAVRHYRRCCALLQEELGMGPMPETEDLYRAIVAGRGAWPPPPGAHDSRELDALRGAMAELDAASASLRRAIRAAEPSRRSTVDRPVMDP